MADSFFRPEGDVIPEWDGKPKNGLSFEQFRGLVVAHVPHWEGEALGPFVAFGDGRRARLTVDCIFHAEREKAEAAMYLHARSACEEENTPFDPDEWVIIRLQLINAC